MSSSLPPTLYVEPGQVLAVTVAQDSALGGIWNFTVSGCYVRILASDTIAPLAGSTVSTRYVQLKVSCKFSKCKHATLIGNLVSTTTGTIIQTFSSAIQVPC